MYKIVEANFLSVDVKHFHIEAPKVAAKQKPGQFAIIRVTDHGERIPLTIAGSNPERGTVELIVQGIGKTTRELNLLNTGDSIQDLAGPLGEPSDLENYGTAVVIGGGVGTAIAYPTAVGLHAHGNHVISIIGARTQDLVILENEMRRQVNETFICTDDGSYGYHGFVTAKLQDLLDEGRKIDYVLAIGPILMMKAVADLTREHDIKTMVSLNPIMIDGTGMCGGCRVTVGGETKFACVDGPEFDGHLVDFKELNRRNRTYGVQERCALDEFIKKSKATE